MILPPAWWTSSMVLTAHRWSTTPGQLSEHQRRYPTRIRHGWIIFFPLAVSTGGRPTQSTGRRRRASHDIGVLLTTGVEADLVHDGDAGLLGSGVQLQHGRADVAGGDDMLLLADGRLDDLGVEGVRDQGDNEVVLGDGGVKGLRVVDIEGGRLGALDASGELLGGREGPAGCRGASGLALGAKGGGQRCESGPGLAGGRWDGPGDQMGLRRRDEGNVEEDSRTDGNLNTGFTQNVQSRLCDEAGAEHKHLAVR